uniref:DUF5641 domain-containing protein n=1 Tax=Loa loa TaxID=7209 RepID=A0A1I7W2N3_LOALO
MRLERYVGTLEKINGKWSEHIQLTPTSQKKKEEEKYEEMANNDRSILNLIDIGTDTIITLSMYKDDTELALRRLTRNKESSLTECCPVVNLSQLFQRSVVILKHGENFGVVSKPPYTLKTYPIYKS